MPASRGGSCRSSFFFSPSPFPFSAFSSSAPASSSTAWPCSGVWGRSWGPAFGALFLFALSEGLRFVFRQLHIGRDDQFLVGLDLLGEDLHVRRGLRDGRQRQHCCNGK